MYTVTAISKSYGRKKVLSEISLTIAPGECVALLGLNGSGKSTLLNILAGNIKSDSGSSGFDSPDKTVALLPQDNPLLPELTAIDNIRLWYGGGRKKILADKKSAICERLGVDTFLHTRVSKLSGGMKKRLSLAITMMAEPDFLLLDEPLAALDMVCREEILTYIRDFTDQGGSALIATHETSAIEICDRIYMLQNGRLKAAYGNDFCNAHTPHGNTDYLKLLKINMKGSEDICCQD